MSILGREARLEAVNYQHSGSKWRKNTTTAEGEKKQSNSHFGGRPGAPGKLASKGMFRALFGPSVWGVHEARLEAVNYEHPGSRPG